MAAIPVHPKPPDNDRTRRNGAATPYSNSLARGRKPCKRLRRTDIREINDLRILLTGGPDLPRETQLKTRTKTGLSVKPGFRRKKPYIL